MCLGMTNGGLVPSDWVECKNCQYFHEHDCENCESRDGCEFGINLDEVEEA